MIPYSAWAVTWGLSIENIVLLASILESDTDVKTIQTQQNLFTDLRADIIISAR